MYGTDQRQPDSLGYSIGLFLYFIFFLDEFYSLFLLLVLVLVMMKTLAILAGMMISEVYGFA